MSVQSDLSLLLNASRVRLDAAFSNCLILLQQIANGGADVAGWAPHSAARLLHELDAWDAA